MELSQLKTKSSTPKKDDFNEVKAYESSDDEEGKGGEDGYGSYGIQMATTLELLGDCAMATERHRTAIDYYREAAWRVHFHFRRKAKCLRKSGAEGSRASGVGEEGGDFGALSSESVLQVQEQRSNDVWNNNSDSSSSTSSMGLIVGCVTSPWEANLRVKECRCLSKVGSIIEAASILERSFPRTHGDDNSNNATPNAGFTSDPLQQQQLQPHKFAVLESHMLLGYLHTLSGRLSEAMMEYKFALQKNPYALEAVEHLAKLGCPENVILNLVDEGLKNLVKDQFAQGAYPGDFSFKDDGTSNIEDSNKSKELGFTPMGGKETNVNDIGKPTKLISTVPCLLPLHEYALAHSTLQKNQLSTSYRHFLRLTSFFPYHPHLLIQLAHIQQELGHILGAEQNYQRVRSLDPHWIEGIDRYAHLLFQLRMSRKNASMLRQGGFLHYQYSCHHGRDKDNGGNGGGSCGVEEELGQLCADLLDSEDKRPEPWVCLSLYHLARDDHEKAMG